MSSHGEQPDIAGLAWKRAQGQAWTEEAQRDLIKLFLIAFMRDHGDDFKAWKVEERRRPLRSWSLYKEPFLIIRMQRRSDDEWAEAAIPFSESQRTDLQAFEAKLALAESLLVAQAD